MSIYTFIPVIFIVLYLGYWFYMKNKNSETGTSSEQHRFQS